MPSLPPALAVGALYDSLLQSALTQFFERAALETEPVPSPSSDGRLAIEPTHDPGALSIRWFGTRYTLRVPPSRPFTAHEVRFARAIGAVLSARYRAILSPQLMVERGDLFRGAIEDRYVGAFFDREPYQLQPGTSSPTDRVALAIEMMRVAALSTYENQPISTGVLLLGSEEDPVGQYPAAERDEVHYTGALTSIKSFYRLADGLRTVFLVNRSGRLLDIVDIGRWADDAAPDRAVDVPCAQTYNGHARATMAGAHVCVVLNPRREIKVFAEGAQVFSFSHADWRLLDQTSKYGICGRLQWAATPWPSGCSAARWTCRTPARAPCSSCCAGRSSRWPSWWRRPIGSTWSCSVRPARRGRRRAATCCTCWPAAR